MNLWWFCFKRLFSFRKFMYLFKYQSGRKEISNEELA